MKKSSFTFPSADGHTAVSAWLWEPETPPCAVLQLSHGMVEHLGRYEPFARFCCENGFVVCGNDHLGHGATAASPEELGFFAEKDGYLLPAADLHTLTGLMKQKFPGLPYFLFGHSMGSFIARDYLARYGQELDGAVLCGTAGKNPMTGPGLLIVNTLALLRGERYRSRFVQKLSCKGYLDRYPEVRSASDWLTKDRAIVEAYDKDSLCHYIFTLSAYRDLMKLLRSVNSAEAIKAVPDSLPVLLIAGEDDPVGNFGKGVREVYDALIAAGKRTELRLYPGDRHELLNELDRETVMRQTADWLKSRIGSPR